MPLAPMAADRQTAKATSICASRRGGIRSLFALADFRQTLEDRLHIPVDVVTSDIDGPGLLRAIARDEVLLYAEGQG